MASQFHLAEVNIARALAPQDDPRMAGFYSRLDEINLLAEGSPGFVWRLKDDTGNATDLRPFDDDRVLINLSVWESVEALMEFTYRSAHKQVLAQRKQWFELFEKPYMTLWWVPVGHIPSVEEAKQRLEHLQAHGATAVAFGFKSVFPPPEQEATFAAEAGSRQW